MADRVGPPRDVALTDGLKITHLRSDLAGPFDLVVPRGCAVVIAGASGSGKSLFLRMVADLDPNEGRVELAGQLREDGSGPAWRRRAPFVAAESGWWGEGVSEHIAPDNWDSAQKIAERIGIGAVQWNSPVARLSTGERHRLALVRALVLDSPMLLLDEPTGPLDPDSVAAVERILVERLRSGTILLMVSHDPRQGERLGAARYRMVDRRLEPEA